MAFSSKNVHYLSYNKFFLFKKKFHNFRENFAKFIWNFFLVKLWQNWSGISRKFRHPSYEYYLIASIQLAAVRTKEEDTKDEDVTVYLILGASPWSSSFSPSSSYLPSSSFKQLSSSFKQPSSSYSTILHHYNQHFNPHHCLQLSSIITIIFSS